MIRVIKVAGLNKPEQRVGIVYCGRPFAGWKGHPLANPFRVVAGDSLGTCLQKYHDWLLARPTLEADLLALWEETGHGSKPLGCWCTNEVVTGTGWEQAVVCHAQILAELLRERFGGGA